MTGPTPDPAAATEKMRARGALVHLVFGYMASETVAVAAELKIADLIGDGVRSSSELAETTGTHEPSLHRLLRALAALGVTTESEPGRFGLTEVGVLLRTDVPDSLYAFTRMFCDQAMFAGWRELGRGIRTGERSFDHVFGKDFFAHLAERPELNALFNQAMSQGTQAAAAQIAAEYDFSGAKTVVDIGGGDGTMLSTILAAHPHLRGIVFDTVTGAEAAPSILAKADAADRCAVRTGDFFEAVPADADLYLVKSVLHDWDDERSRAILNVCRSAMPAEARLLIVEPVMPETVPPGTMPLQYLSDLNMLVNTGGLERTQVQFRELLGSSGFTLRSVTPLGPTKSLSLIEATPA